jgi:hypothetical protein
MEIADLGQEFGLEGDLLEDVTSAINRAAPGELVQDLQPLESRLPMRVRVAGVRYENRPQVALISRPGMPVTLARDYDNTIDRNAIQVLVSGEQLGFLPRPIAQYLAPEMDTGVELDARITTVSRSNGPAAEVEISLSMSNNVPA